MKKILSLISPRIKNILGQAVFSGMEKGEIEVSSNKIYSVGIGRDLRQRLINAEVTSALNTAILVAEEPNLFVKTIEHSTGHSLMITYGRLSIYPKRVDFKNPDHEDDPDYHKELIANNPTKQGDLFDINDPDNSILALLSFGRNKHGFFAFLSIPDSSGGIYEKEELKLQPAEILAPEERVRMPKKLAIRSEKISEQ
jgi:hypothetical protein